MKFVLCLVIGYLVGSINPSYFIGRMKGFDIRSKGSGNAGASNAVILMGKKWGAISALFDIFKAFFVVFLAETVICIDLPYVGILTGGACILGHIFPFYMGFRGGKGLACLGGTILAFDWRVFIVLLAAEILLVLLVDYLCAVPISASVAFPVIYFIKTGEWIGALAFLVVTAVIIFRHIDNLRRISRGQEVHFSYLWKKEKELERLKKNTDKQ